MPPPSSTTPIEIRAAPGDFDVDAGGAGVEGVFNQFFDGAGGPLDHLAGGDPADQLGGQRSDAGHWTDRVGAGYGRTDSRYHGDGIPAARAVPW
jgi:hypothetical protein